MQDTLGSLRLLQHDQIPKESTPEYAVPTAADAVVAGTYTVFPAAAEHESGVRPVAGDVSDVAESPAVQAAVQADVEQLIKGRLLTTRVPRHVTRVDVRDGCLFVEARGEFAAVLTLESTAPWCDWRVLRVDMLVNAELEATADGDGGAAGAGAGEGDVDSPARHPSKTQLLHLGALAQQQMAGSPQPIVVLYVACCCCHVCPVRVPHPGLAPVRSRLYTAPSHRAATASCTASPCRWRWSAWRTRRAPQPPVGGVASWACTCRLGPADWCWRTGTRWRALDPPLPQPHAPVWPVPSRRQLDGRRGTVALPVALPVLLPVALPLALPCTSASATVPCASWLSWRRTWRGEVVMVRAAAAAAVRRRRAWVARGRRCRAATRAWATAMVRA